MRKDRMQKDMTPDLYNELEDTLMNGLQQDWNALKADTLRTFTQALQDLKNQNPDDFGTDDPRQMARDMFRWAVDNLQF